MTAPIRDLEVRFVPTSSLKPYRRNPRTHSPKQIRQVARSIEEFGWTNPILVDGDCGVIAGHARLEAAKLGGIADVPVIHLADMTPERKRAYIIADNKLAENAGWDRDLLMMEIRDLIEIDSDFDVTLTGFEMGEIDLLLKSTEDEPTVPDIDPDGPVVTRPGDLWHLGPHRLLCGDATRQQAFEQLLGNERAEMVFIDPPYNVPIKGHVSGLGKVRHREFAMASGEMSEAAFIAFLRRVFSKSKRLSANGYPSAYARAANRMRSECSFAPMAS